VNHSNRAHAGRLERNNVMRRALRLASFVLLLSVPALAFADPPQQPGEKNGYRCPSGLEKRTPAQVWADRIEAMKVGDLDRVMCDYAKDAVVLTPGGIARGKDQIRFGLQMMFQLLGGVLPTVTTLQTADDVVFVTFTVDTPIVSIVDGADTYVIKHGLIVSHTAHDPLIFKGPPPAPAAASAEAAPAEDAAPAEAVAAR
jgi:hypothetical protein